MTPSPIPATASPARNESPAVREAVRRIGLVDIGSATIRLVIYRIDNGSPVAQFNERMFCNLGHGLHATGRIGDAELRHALAALERFGVIIGRSALDDLLVFATEAVRRAANRDDFLIPARAMFATPIRILAGEEESYYAGLGVVSGGGGDGVVGDLGGGSLEMQPITRAGVAMLPPGMGSLPLGHLRGHGEAEIKSALAGIPWLGDHKGQIFHAVGGTWRAIATAHAMSPEGKNSAAKNSAAKPSAATPPHGLALTPDILESAMSRIEAAGGDCPGIPPPRRGSMAQAIRVMRCVVEILAPSAIIFSNHGVREGLLHERLHGKGAGV